MTETVLTFRELFQVDPNKISARLESELDAYQSAQNARQEIEKAARAIRWPWVRGAVIEQARGLLDLNVLEVLTEAWKKYMEVAKYADPRYAGEKITVALAEHTLESEHHPFVQILFDEREVGRITFDLTFSLKLEGFVLQIRDGRIWEVETGSAKGAGKLSLAEVELWKRELKPVHFPGNFSFENGIALPAISKAASGSTEGR